MTRDNDSRMRAEFEAWFKERAGIGMSEAEKLIVKCGVFEGWRAAWAASRAYGPSDDICGYAAASVEAANEKNNVDWSYQEYFVAGARWYRDQLGLPQERSEAVILPTWCGTGPTNTRYINAVVDKIKRLNPNVVFREEE